MYQPHPSAGQSAGPAPPPAPAPVRTAVRLMYAGAAVSAVPLIAAPAYAGDIGAYHLHWGSRSLTAAQISHWRPLIVAVVIAVGLVVPALWVWLARAVGRGRNWARILSTVLFGLATLQLISDFQGAVSSGTAEPVLGLLGAALTWPVGAAAVWLLWRLASSAFFRPPRLPRLV